MQSVLIVPSTTPSSSPSIALSSMSDSSLALSWKIGSIFRTFGFERGPITLFSQLKILLLQKRHYQFEGYLPAVILLSRLCGSPTPNKSPVPIISPTSFSWKLGFTNEYAYTCSTSRAASRLFTRRTSELPKLRYRMKGASGHLRTHSRNKSFGPAAFSRRIA